MEEQTCVSVWSRLWIEEGARAGARGGGGGERVREGEKGCRTWQLKDPAGPARAIARASRARGSVGCVHDSLIAGVARGPLARAATRPCLFRSW